MRLAESAIPFKPDVLAACDRASRRRFAARETFFISATGNPVTAATVGVMFNRIWDQAGLPRPADGPRPRPYDLRHHFAYANIERWMAQGQDVTALLRDHGEDQYSFHHGEAVADANTGTTTEGHVGEAR